MCPQQVITWHLHLGDLRKLGHIQPFVGASDSSHSAGVLPWLGPLGAFLALRMFWERNLVTCVNTPPWKVSDQAQMLVLAAALSAWVTTVWPVTPRNLSVQTVTSTSSASRQRLQLLWDPVVCGALHPGKHLRQFEWRKGGGWGPQSGAHLPKSHVDASRVTSPLPIAGCLFGCSGFCDVIFSL